MSTLLAARPSYSPPPRSSRTPKIKRVPGKSTSISMSAYFVDPALSDTTKIKITTTYAGQLLDPERVDLKVGARLRQLAMYTDGWFGPDSLAASPRAIEDAEKFTKMLDFKNMHIPHISLSEDGEVNFWWDFPNFRLDLGMFGDGTYVYYARLNDGREIAQDGIPINIPLPFEIVEQLKKQ